MSFQDIINEHVKKHAGWTQQEALVLCMELWKPLDAIGFHIALTGSVLYAGGSENDLDLVLYPDHTDTSDEDGFEKLDGFRAVMRSAGFTEFSRARKDSYNGASVLTFVRPTDFGRKSQSVDVFLMNRYEEG